MRSVFFHFMGKTKVQIPLIALDPAQESRYQCDFDGLEGFLYRHLAFD